MKWSIPLAVIGALALLFGIAVMIGGVNHSPVDRAFSIDPGPYFINYYSESLSAGQTIQVDFKVTGGTTVEVYIFNEAQWNDYKFDGTASSLDHDSGSQGTVSLNVEKGGTYYFAIEHGSGYSNTLQEGTTTFKITGTNVPTVIIGAVVLAVGVVMVVAGAVLNKKEKAAARAAWQPEQTGVLYYQDQQPPQQPPIQPPPQ